MAGAVENSLYAETQEEYDKDKRSACKYGVKCYQKNKQHLSKYKHPPKPRPSEAKQSVKRPKTDDSPLRNEGSEDDVSNPGGEDNKAGSSTDTSKLVEQPAKRAKIDNPVSKNEDPEKNADSSLKKSDKSEEDTADANSPDASSASTSPAREKQDHASSDPKETIHSSSGRSADCSESIGGEADDVRDRIKQKFLVEMPDDFYSFWDFCKSLSKDNPADALKDVGLRLVGPYDELAGKLKVTGKECDPSLFLRHWRYYFDPPEFQTVLKGDDKIQFHMGYFRDEPRAMPVFVASNSAVKGGVITPVAENIFGAVYAFLSDAKKSCSPFIQTKIPKLQNLVKEWAGKHGFTLDTMTPAMKQRNRKIVSRTFHGAGLVVPVDKKTDVGYRELLETDSNLKRILRRVVESKSDEEQEAALDKLQPIITAANIANDECDFGTSVELGLDLFTFGSEVLDRSALQLLSTGYSLLGRKEFAKIAEAHLTHRVKGLDINMFP